MHYVTWPLRLLSYTFIAFKWGASISFLFFSCYLLTPIWSNMHFVFSYEYRLIFSYYFCLFSIDEFFLLFFRPQLYIMTARLTVKLFCLKKVTWKVGIFTGHDHIRSLDCFTPLLIFWLFKEELMDHIRLYECVFCIYGWAVVKTKRKLEMNPQHS